MKDLPFSVYDFFAYLASGFVLFWFVGYAFDLPWLVATEPSALLLLQWVIAAYVVGHVIAHISSSVIEGTVMNRWLRQNEATLFRGSDGWRSRCFPGFFKKLPHATQERVLARVASSGIDEPSEGLYFHCFASVKNDATALARMNTFLNLYGFARNISMACLLGIVALTIGALRPFLEGGSPSFEKQWMIVPSLVIAIIMFYRYLKFYRLYGVEVYVTYAAQE